MIGFHLHVHSILSKTRHSLLIWWLIDFRQNNGLVNFINLVEKAVSNGSFLIIRNLDESVDHIFHPIIYILLTQIQIAETQGTLKDL